MPFPIGNHWVSCTMKRNNWWSRIPKNRYIIDCAPHIPNCSNCIRIVKLWIHRIYATFFFCFQRNIPISHECDIQSCNSTSTCSCNKHTIWINSIDILVMNDITNGCIYILYRIEPRLFYRCNVLLESQTIINRGNYIAHTCKIVPPFWESQVFFITIKESTSMN